MAMVITARQAGAQGDGTDDGPALNEALQRLSSTEGGQLRLDNKVYTTDEPLLIDTNSVSIAGLGWADHGSAQGSVIRAGAGFTDPGIIGFEPAVVKVVSKQTDGRPVLGCHLGRFQVSRGPAGVHGIYLRSARGHFERLMTDNNGGSGMYIEGARNGVGGATVDWDTYDTIIEHHQSGLNGLHGLHIDPTGAADLHLMHGIWYGNTLDGALVEGASNQFNACHLYDNNRNNMTIRGVRQWVQNCKLEGAAEHGLACETDSAAAAFYGQVIVGDCGFKGNSRGNPNQFDEMIIYGDVADGGFTVNGNRYSRLGSTPRYGLNLEGTTPTQGIVSGNSFIEVDGAWGTAPVNFGGANTAGFKTEFGVNAGVTLHQQGLQTIPSGISQVTVTHGLSTTPDQGEVFLTFNSPAGGVTEFYADNFNAATFRINCFPAPSVDTEMAWHATIQGPTGPAGT